jgi:hypothetical protein
MELIGILALGTLGAVTAFAYISVRATEKLRDSDEPRSSLSRDGIEQRLRAARNLS